MKRISRWVDRFCYDHPRFGVANLMVYIIAVTGGVYFLGLMDRTKTLYFYLSFSWPMICQGQVWRLVTFLFIPPAEGMLTTALFLYFYYIIGRVLEQAWGTVRFTLYYLAGWLFVMVFGCAASAIFGPEQVILTAEYLNLSLFFAFTLLNPDAQVLFLFIIPLKVKWLALVDALFFLYAVIALPFPTSLLPIVSVLNLLIFRWPEICRLFTVRRRRPTQAPQFTVRSNPVPQGHRCEVCGRTAAEYPDLEFRYCSRCQGYHCFCIDHINSHIHHSD